MKNKRKGGDIKISYNSFFIQLQNPPFHEVYVL